MSFPGPPYVQGNTMPAQNTHYLHPRHVQFMNQGRRTPGRQYSPNYPQQVTAHQVTSASPYYIHDPAALMVGTHVLPIPPHYMPQPYQRPFSTMVSPTPSSLHTVDSSRNGSQSSRTMFQVVQPAEETMGRFNPNQEPVRPRSAPAQYESSTNLSSSASNIAVPSGNVTVQPVVPVAQPQLPQEGHFSLTWSSASNDVQFQYNGPYSKDVIEGLLKVREDHDNSLKVKQILAVTTTHPPTNQPMSPNSSEAPRGESTTSPPNNPTNTNGTGGTT